MLGLNCGSSNLLLKSLSKIEKRVEVKMVFCSYLHNLKLSFPEMTCALLSKEKVSSLQKLFGVQ